MLVSLNFRSDISFVIYTNTNSNTGTVKLIKLSILDAKVKKKQVKCNASNFTLLLLKISYVNYNIRNFKEQKTSFPIWKE